MILNQRETSYYNLDVRKNRNYQINIVTPSDKYIEVAGGKLEKRVVESEEIIIAPPFTITMSIDRNVLASCNSVKITINNLSEKTRMKLIKDQYTFSEYWSMRIKAGYGDYMNQIFKGNIQTAYSYKQNTEWITEIEGYDGIYAMQNGFVSMTAQKNTSYRDMLGSVINTMPKVIKGAIGEKGNETTGDRGFVVFGKSGDVLKKYGADNNYIDEEKVFLLDRGEYVGDEALIIDSDHLLASPKRRDAYVECELMFTPEVKIGYLADLNSVFPVYNGQYIIQSIKHKFEWSSSACGEAKTTLGLYCGTKIFQKVAAQ